LFPVIFSNDVYIWDKQYLNNIDMPLLGNLV
jgi:hypothetical protein